MDAEKKQTLPAIGRRVAYIEPGRELTGTVVAHYPAYTFRDADTGERIDYPAHVAVKVDTLPDWWPYTGTDVFTPSIDDIRKA
jgi:hypothetical protein